MLRTLQCTAGTGWVPCYVLHMCALTDLVGGMCWTLSGTICPQACCRNWLGLLLYKCMAAHA